SSCAGGSARRPRPGLPRAARKGARWRSAPWYLPGPRRPSRATFQRPVPRRLRLPFSQGETMVMCAPGVKRGSAGRAKRSHVFDELVMAPDAVPETTHDLIYGGRVKVRQPARGYRVNIDTILIAAALPPAGVADTSRIVELGCGVGAALMAVAHNHAQTRPN